MTSASPLLLALDLTGTFAFGLNGALTAVKATRLDIVGVVTLGVITAVGGGIIRDVLIGDVPPATLRDWRYLTLAVGGGLVVFTLSQRLHRLEMPINVLDAVGLSVFAVIGASKALTFGLGVGPAIILGTITGVGGGTIRDTLIGQVPIVLRSELYAIPAAAAGLAVLVAGNLGAAELPAAVGAAVLWYAIPALIAAGITVATIRMGIYGLSAALAAAAVCFVIRMLGVHFGLNAPGPPGARGDSSSPDAR
jgi:uncharacterized membrane protein YeiH